MNTFLDQISVDYLIAFGFKPCLQRSPKREHTLKNCQRRQEKRDRLQEEQSRSRQSCQSQPKKVG